MARLRVSRHGWTALVALVVAAVIFGAQQMADSADSDGAGRSGGASTPRVVSPSAPLDFPCPGETPTPTIEQPQDGASALDDRYVENHQYRVPFPLHGQRRCDGIAAAQRITAALEPLRAGGDLSPGTVRAALTGLGYSEDDVEAHFNGPVVVNFLVDATPLCLEGSLNRVGVEVTAFGGYPDHVGCDTPSGGH